MQSSIKHNSTKRITHIIVMGVSGCGKSTLGQALATRLGWPFLEGDTYHPAANVTKMKAGTPLDDSDRAPWLAALALALHAHPAAVLACSALKARYRAVLQGGETKTALEAKTTLFVHVKGEFAEIAARMRVRAETTGHYMPDTLLQSQFDALECPSPAEVHCINIDNHLDTAAQLAFFEQNTASLSMPPPDTSTPYTFAKGI